MTRFSIRDLLWLTVLVALGVAWWVDRIQLDRQYRAQVEAAKGKEFAIEWLQRAVTIQRNRADELEEQVKKTNQIRR